MANYRGAPDKVSMPRDIDREGREAGRPHPAMVKTGVLFTRMQRMVEPGQSRPPGSNGVKAQVMNGGVRQESKAIMQEYAFVPEAQDTCPGRLGIM